MYDLNKSGTITKDEFQDILAVYFELLRVEFGVLGMVLHSCKHGHNPP